MLILQFSFQLIFIFVMMKKFFSIAALSVFCFCLNDAHSQTVKILFDATKAETAGNADWIIDADLFNLDYNPNATVGGGNEANAQRIPTPAQSGITASTSETYWKGGLSNWGVDCVKKGYTVETLPYNGSITYGNASNPQDLTNYKVYIVCEPNILFTAAQKTAIINFVSNGGGLFVVSDHNGSDRNGDGDDSPHILNDLFNNNGIQVNPFGFTFDYSSFSQTSSNIPNLPNDSLLNGPMGNVTKVQWSSGTSITLSTTANSTAKGVAYKTGSAFGSANVLCAYSRFGNGKVVALGDSSPCDDGTGDTNDNLYNGYIVDASGNHQKLIMNATIWLATAGSGSLPLNFTSFSVQKEKENQAALSWTTALSGNTSVAHFDIQRSENGNSFYSIASHPFVENLPTQPYHFTDANVVASKEFYRIASVENDRTTYTDTKSLSFSTPLHLSLSPNPAGNDLYISFGAVSNGELIITGSAGTVLRKYKLSPLQQKLHISTREFTPGMYAVQMMENGKMVTTESFIRQ